MKTIHQKSAARLSLGFSLVEVLLAIVVFGVVGYALANFMLSRATVAERLETAKGASDRLENALHILTVIPYNDLPLGGSFARVDDATIQPLPCTAQTCDFILDPETSGSTDSLVRGTVWQSGYVAPSGVNVAYVRRWLIEEVDAELKLRRITVAVLADEQSANPLSMVSTIVGDR